MIKDFNFIKLGDHGNYSFNKQPEKGVFIQTGFSIPYWTAEGNHIRVDTQKILSEMERWEQGSVLVR